MVIKSKRSKNGCLYLQMHQWTIQSEYLYWQTELEIKCSQVYHQQKTTSYHAENFGKQQTKLSSAKKDFDEFKPSPFTHFQMLQAIGG